MKKTVILLLLLASSLTIIAQQDIPLPGVVVVQNSKYNTGKIEYVPNASIKAIMASPTMSDNKGQFTLLFTDRPYGDVTRIFAEKHGMEVVNKTDLEEATVIGRKQKLKVVMCKKGNLYQNQLFYYNVARDFIQEKYQKRLSILKQEGELQQQVIKELETELSVEIKGKQDAIFKLEEELSSTLEMAREFSEKFAIVNLDEVDDLYLKAHKAYEAKQFNEVLRILQYDNLKQNIEGAKKNIISADNIEKEGNERLNKGRTNLAQGTQNAVFAARVSVVANQYNKAYAYYDLAIEGDNKNIDYLAEAAEFLSRQNKHEKAINYYQRALELQKNDWQTATILNNLGMLYDAKNDISKAVYYINEVVNICQNTSENPIVFLPILASARNNLGNLYRNTKETTQAIEQYEAALSILRKLADKNETFLNDVAYNLSNLAMVYQDNLNMEGAKRCHEEALKIHRGLSEKKPDKYLPYLASSLNNSLNFYISQNESHKALEYIDEALKINQQLAIKNPDAFLPDLAMVLHNKGYVTQSEPDKSIEYRKEASEIYRKLAAQNPKVFLPDLAMNLINIGGFYLDLEKLDEATLYLNEALVLTRKLAEKNPNLYQEELAMILNNMGVITSVNQQTDQAILYHQEALFNRHLLAKKSPTYLPDLAETFDNLGILYTEKEDNEKAIEHLEKALKIYRELSEKDTIAFKQNIATTLNSLGNIYRKMEYFKKAENYYSEALKIRYSLVEKDSTTFFPDLAMTLNSYGNLFMDKTQYEEAIPYYEKALNIYKKLAQKDPNTFNIDAGMACINIAKLHKQKLRKSYDISTKEKGIKILEDANNFLKIYPPNHPTVSSYKTHIQKTKKYFVNATPQRGNESVLRERIVRLNKDISKIEKLEDKIKPKEELLNLLINFYDQFGGLDTKNLIVLGCADLSWNYIFTKQYQKAEEISLKGLEADPSQYLLFNGLATAYVLQDKWIEAKKIYQKMKKINCDETRTCAQTFLDGLEELTYEWITTPELVEKAKNYLNEE